MDQYERLARVEALVDTIRDELDRMHAGIERLANEIAQLREHTDRGLAELRERTDRGFAEARQHTDDGLEQLRKEFNATTRWLVGLMLANTAMTLGMFAKVVGMF
jgi:uncharacterized coiled-coil DUF342 family protein